MPRMTAFALTALLVTACASTPPEPVLPAGEAIGQPIVPQEIVPFATVDANPSDYFHRTVLVEASVTAVCQAKGCWMQVEDQGKRAMVRWETGCGGEYAFPLESVGHRVVIQGSFYPKEISEADAEHLVEESGGTLEVDREGYEFNASAVLVTAEPTGT